MKAGRFFGALAVGLGVTLAFTGAGFGENYGLTKPADAGAKKVQSAASTPAPKAAKSTRKYKKK